MFQLFFRVKIIYDIYRLTQSTQVEKITQLVLIKLISLCIIKIANYKYLEMIDDGVSWMRLDYNICSAYPASIRDTSLCVYVCAYIYVLLIIIHINKINLSDLDKTMILHRSRYHLVKLGLLGDCGSFHEPVKRLNQGVMPV